MVFVQGLVAFMSSLNWIKAYTKSKENSINSNYALIRGVGLVSINTGL